MRLVAADGGGDRFGRAVALADDTSLVGAPRDEEFTGSAYVFGFSEPEGPPRIVGDNPPRDLNGDGLYRDINGDGEFTIADVQVSFQNRDANVVRDNAECFNFDGEEPATGSIRDVQALFLDFTEGVSRDE